MRSLILLVSLAVFSTSAWADSTGQCVGASHAVTPQGIEAANAIVSTFADPDICRFSDLQAFCKAKNEWIDQVLYAKTQNPVACQSYGNQDLNYVDQLSPECAASMKAKFVTTVMPAINGMFNQILNHSDYVDRCCQGNAECAKKMHSVPIRFFPDRAGCTGYDDDIAPGALAVCVNDAYSYDPDMEKAMIMHELGHACHETLVPLPYDSPTDVSVGVRRARAMEKLISDRFGADYLSCIQQEFGKKVGKAIPNWKDPSTYSVGLNRLYNETFAESFTAPIAPKAYQGITCEHPDDLTTAAFYYPSTACRFKIPRLKAQYCKTQNGH